MTQEEWNEYYRLRWKRREEAFKGFLFLGGIIMTAVVAQHGLMKPVRR